MAIEQRTGRINSGDVSLFYRAFGTKGRTPILILQGTKDVQMSVKDAEYLEEELKRAEHRDFTVRVLPDVDYLLQTCKGAGTIKALSEPSQPIDPAVLSSVTEWLQKKLSTVNRP